jgi:hypothetical protein
VDRDGKPALFEHAQRGFACTHGNVREVREFPRGRHACTRSDLARAYGPFKLVRDDEVRGARLVQVEAHVIDARCPVVMTGVHWCQRVSTSTSIWAMSTSGSGGTWLSERTAIDRDMFNQLIDALLDGDEDQRIAAAAALSQAAPSWWSGPTRHRAREHEWRRDGRLAEVEPQQQQGQLCGGAYGVTGRVARNGPGRCWTADRGRSVPRASPREVQSACGVCY